MLSQLPREQNQSGAISAVMENKAEKYGSLDNQGSQAKAKQTRPYWQQRKLRKNKAALARKSRQSKILDSLDTVKEIMAACHFGQSKLSR